MDKKMILIFLLAVGIAVSAVGIFLGSGSDLGGGLTLSDGTNPRSGSGDGGTQGGTNIRTYGTVGDDRPIFLREIHVLLKEIGFDDGLVPANTASGGKIVFDMVVSVGELAVYIDVIGLTKGAFDDLIEQYFAPSPGLANLDEIVKDTRPIEMGRVHRILKEMGFDAGLNPISPPYLPDHMLRVGALWLVHEELGLNRAQFETLISTYFDGDDSIEHVNVPGGELAPDDTVPYNWAAEGEVYTGDLVLVVFELYNLDLHDHISDIPDVMFMADFKAVAPAIGFTEDQVYEIYMTMLIRGDIQNGNTSLLDGNGGSLVDSDSFASVADEPASTMSAWAVDGFEKLSPHLPPALVELIRHNPRGPVTTAELNKIVLAMYAVSDTDSKNAPQWPHVTVMRGQAINILVDAYLSILMAKGGDVLVATNLSDDLDMSHFADFSDIGADMELNVSIAYDKKWMTGTSETTLGVMENFDRQQVVAIASRILGDLGYE